MKVVFYLINKGNKEKEVRQEPRRTLSDDFWEGFYLLLTENGTTLVLQN